ncbi:MAG: agmatinase [Hyphomicrobiales bacterium]
MSDAVTPGDAAFRRKSLLGTDVESTYAGALSFMRRLYTRDLTGADVAVSGVPFDMAVTNRPGTRFGPEAIRKASAHNAWGPTWPWNFDPFDTLAVVDYGDCYFDHGEPNKIAGVIEKHASDILEKDVSMLTLGGDHFISYPLLKANAAVHGPLGLIQFDAHCDLEDDDVGRTDHGCMFRYAVDEGIIDPNRSIQVGVRTSPPVEGTFGITILHADWVHENGPAKVAEEIKRVTGGGKSYMTFDIDCLDPAFAPGTGTPVPGGLSSYQALAIMRHLVEVNFAGADIVEVSPPYDHAEITALAAAMIAAEYLCVLAAQKGA